MAGDPLVSFILGGDPVPKGRPRFRIVQPRGKPQFVTVYTDAATAAYERALAHEAQIAMAGRKPLDGALTAFIEVFLAIPASWSGKKHAAAAAGDIPHISRPDGDNFAKAALDSCNGIVWGDDSQIVMLQVLKVYSEWPRLRISIWLWDDVGPPEPEFL